MNTAVQNARNNPNELKRIIDLLAQVGIDFKRK